MLTTEDIQKLTEYQKTIFPTREEVATKDDLKKIETKVDLLTNAVDTVLKEIKDNRTERTVVEHRVKKLETAVTKLSVGTGIPIN
jgi:hypothetical protein